MCFLMKKAKKILNSIEKDACLNRFFIFLEHFYAADSSLVVPII